MPPATVYSDIAPNRDRIKRLESAGILDELVAALDGEEHRLLHVIRQLDGEPPDLIRTLEAEDTTPDTDTLVYERPW